MDFLIQAQINLPHTLTAAERTELIAAEAARAKELAAAGHTRRVWRVPGRFASWGIWQADSNTEIHDAVSSLPMWRYMDLHVHPLALHPNDPGLDIPRQ